MHPCLLPPFFVCMHLPAACPRLSRFGLSCPESPALPFHAGTPADTMLTMIEDLLRDDMPTLPSIMLVRTALLHNYDVYQPVNLKKHMQGANLDVGAPGPGLLTHMACILLSPLPGMACILLPRLVLHPSSHGLHTTHCTSCY